MEVNDRIVYDSYELINMMETQLDKLGKFRFDTKYRSLLGERIIEKLNHWDNAIRKQKDSPLTLVVCGEFKRGKSSLINAMLGEDVVTTNVTTETITTNRISYGPHSNEIILSGGKRVKLSDDELQRDALGKILSELPERASRMEIRRPIEVLKKVTIIDTPGLGDAMQDFAADVNEALQQADAVVYLYSVTYPLSVQEQIFIKSAIKPQKYTDLFIVGNYADMIGSPDDCARVLNVATDRLNDILPGEQPILLSALDERCRQLGTERPNAKMTEYLEQNFDALRERLSQLLEEKHDCVIPDRIERMINTMSADLAGDIESIKIGLSMNDEQIAHKLKEIDTLKEDQTKEHTELFQMIDDKSCEYRGDCADAMDRFVTAMESDVDSLKSLPVEDVRKYYSLFVIDTLQTAISKCNDYFMNSLYDALDDISADISKNLSFSSVSHMPRFKMSMQSKTWTQGDNVAMVTSFTGISSIPIISNVAGFVAGTMRDKEIANKLPTIVEDIKKQYPSLRASALKALTEAFRELTEKAKLQVTEYFNEQTAEIEKQAEESAAVARKDAESKAEIEAALNELITCLDSIKEALTAN